MVCIAFRTNCGTPSDAIYKVYLSTIYTHTVHLQAVMIVLPYGHDVAEASRLRTGNDGVPPLGVAEASRISKTRFVGVARMRRRGHRRYTASTKTP